MIIDIASALLLLLSIGGVVFIVVKKVHLVAAIDVDMIPAERHSAMKNEIISLRIKRKLMSIVHLSSIFGEPIRRLLSVLQKRIRAFHASMLAIRATYYKKVHVGGARASTVIPPIDSAIESTVQVTKRLIASNAIDQAERVLIDALKDDPRNAELTDILASIYVRKKEWDQARETSEYTCKLRHDAMSCTHDNARSSLIALYAESLSDLARIYLELERGADAIKTFKKIIALLPDNPKYLHEFTELYISLRMRFKAEQVLAQLKGANPDQKIDDIRAKIEALSY